MTSGAWQKSSSGQYVLKADRDARELMSKKCKLFVLDFNDRAYIFGIGFIRFPNGS